MIFALLMVGESIVRLLGPLPSGLKHALLIAAFGFAANATQVMSFCSAREVRASPDVSVPHWTPTTHGEGSDP